MATRGPWSVKGIDSKAREAALQAARSEGITLGDYLNRMLLESDDPRGETLMSGSLQNQASNDESASRSLEELDRLTRRIEAIETRSTLAITGIDQSVVGLLSRLENSDIERSALEGQLSNASSELKKAQSLLETRIERMEDDETSHDNMRSLKKLESALERLVTRVEQGHNSLSEIDDRVSDVKSNIDGRVDELSKRVETTLTEAADKVSQAVQQAELRTEGAARHLSERMSSLEAELFEEKRQNDSRLSNVEGQVTATLSSVSENVKSLGEKSTEALDQVESISSRLADAETITNEALEHLKDNVRQLDSRLEELDNDLEGDRLSEFKSRIEDRLSTIAVEVSESVGALREEMAEQIAQAANTPAEAFVELNNVVSQMHKRMKRAEQKQTQSVEAMGEEVAKLTQVMDKRVSQVEQRNQSELSSDIRDQLDELARGFEKKLSALEHKAKSTDLDQVSEQMNELADVLNKRVHESEERSATAIRDFADHVSTLNRNLTARQEKGLQKIANEIEASEQRQSMRMDKAFSSVKDRIAQVEQATEASMSPIQKAMASLADRLQAVEDFATPPGAPKNEPENLKLTSFEDTLSAAITSLDRPTHNPESATPTAQPEQNADLPDLDRASQSLEALPDDPWADDEDAFTPSESENEFGDGADEFSADISSDTFSYDLDEAEADEDILETNLSEVEGFENTSEPVNAGDYISRARAAANANMDASRSSRHSPKRGKSGGGGNSRIPLVAAASVVAITAAGTVGYMAMRGKQEPSLEYVTGVNPSESLDLLSEDAPMSDETEYFSEDDIEAAAAETSETGSAKPLPEEAASKEAAKSSQSEQFYAGLDDTSVEADLNNGRDYVATPTALASPKPSPTPTTTQIGTAPKPVREAPAQLAAAQPQPARDLAPGVNDYQVGVTALNNGQISDGAKKIRAAAEAGLPIAQYRMSKLHERGQGVPRDLQQSRAWTEKAANGGNVKAMHDLAVFYAEGEGGPQSYAGAVQWFRAAADYGLIDSQYNLGILYEQGLGVTANPSEALYWFRVAQKLGDSSAASKVAELAPTVPQETAEQTALLAGQYKAKESDPLANGRFPAQQASSAAEKPVAAASSSTDAQQLAMVREAQTLLNSMGYNAGAPDGQFGSQTRRAILTFQTANGLPQSGQVTPTLVRQLRSTAAGI